MFIYTKQILKKDSEATNYPNSLVVFTKLQTKAHEPQNIGLFQILDAYVYTTKQLMNTWTKFSKE